MRPQKHHHDTVYATGAPANDTGAIRITVEAPKFAENFFVFFSIFLLKFEFEEKGAKDVLSNGGFIECTCGIANAKLLSPHQDPRHPWKISPRTVVLFQSLT